MRRARIEQLIVAAFVLGACSRAGFSPLPAAPAPPLDASRSLDGSQPDAEPFGFDPAHGRCIESDEGPFVEVGSFATPSSAFGVWYVAPYVLVASMDAGIVTLTFDGSSFKQHHHLDDIGWAEAIWSEGHTVYLASPGFGLSVLELHLDGRLTVLAQDTTRIDEARRLWGGGDLLYVPNGKDLHAYRFAEGELTAVGEPLGSQGWAGATWTADGKTIFFADGTKLRVLSFDGTRFNEITSAARKNTSRVWGQGEVIFVASSAGAAAYRLDDAELKLLAEAPTAGTAREVWSDGQHVFVAAETAGVYAFRFSNDAFVEVDRFDTDGFALGVVGDGTYIYVGDRGEGVRAYTGFACRRQGE